MYYDLNSEGDNRTMTLGSKKYLVGELNEEQKREVEELLQLWAWERDEDKLKDAWSSVIHKILSYFNDGVLDGIITDKEFEDFQFYVNKQLWLWE